MQGAVGEELKERRRLIASTFGSGGSLRDGAAVDPTSVRRERPRTPAGAEKVLSARTIFMPAADGPETPEAPQAAPAEPAAEPASPQQKNLIAVIAVAIGLTVAFSLALAIKSLTGHHPQANGDQGAETIPPTLTPTPRPQPVEPPPARDLVSPAQTPHGP